MRNFKVIILTNELPPYRRYLFSQLSKYIKNIQFYFVLTSRIEPFRTWDPIKLDPNIYILKSLKFKSNFGYIYIPNVFSLINIIIRVKPDIIISGQLGPTSFFMAILKNIFNFKLILWLESHMYADVKLSLFRKIFRKVILLRADAFWFYSNYSFSYFKNHILNKNYIVSSQIFDFESFYNKLKTINEIRKREIKKKLGLDGYDKIVAYIGRLEPYKGIEQLLNIWKIFQLDISNSNLKVALVILGYGSLENMVEFIIKQEKLMNVYYIGKVNYNEIFLYYSIIDLLVFPTLWETWGFVVNEALCAGVPVLVSYRAASSEIVINGDNGDKIDPFDTKDVIIKIKKWLSIDKQKKSQIALNFIINERLRLLKLLEDFKNLMYKLCPYV